MRSTDSMQSPRSALLLMFAYHFPPENAIGGARPFRFAKNLSRLGVPLHVFTAADVSARPDLNAETVIDPFVSKPRCGIGWQAERAIRKFFLPGATGSQWAVNSYKAACRFLASQPLTQSDYKRPIVFSTYPPLGTALAGYWLAKRRGLRWILDFRDPMGDNPSDKHLSGFQKAIYCYLERKFVRAADCVVANTDAAQARLRKKFPEMADNISLLWNGFDPEQRLGPLPVPARTKRVYSHVGELYEGRIITPLLLSIDRLIRTGRLSPADFLIQLIGSVRSTSVPDTAFMTEATNKGWLRVVSEHLPQAEAHRIMQESDGLVLVQPHSTLQVPGKLFEYVPIGRPILAYIPTETPIERILRQSNIPCTFAYSSGGDEFLDSAVLSFFKLDHRAVKPSKWFEDVFNAERQADQLLQLINQLEKGSPASTMAQVA